MKPKRFNRVFSAYVTVIMLCLPFFFGATGATAAAAGNQDKQGIKNKQDSQDNQDNQDKKQKKKEEKTTILGKTPKRETLQHLLDKKYTAALQSAIKNLEDARKKKDYTSEFYFLNLIGSTYESAGLLEKALTYYRSVKAHCDRFGMKLKSAVALKNMGHVFVKQSHFKKAAKCFREALDVCIEERFFEGIGWTSASLGKVYFYMNDYPSALKYMKQAADTFDRHGAHVFKVMVLGETAYFHGMLKNYAAAVELYDDALALAKKTGFDVQRMNLYLPMLEMLTEMGDIPKVEKILKEAKTLLPFIADKDNRNLGEARLVFAETTLLLKKKKCTEALELLETTLKKNERIRADKARYLIYSAVSLFCMGLVDEAGKRFLELHSHYETERGRLKGDTSGFFNSITRQGSPHAAYYLSDILAAKAMTGKYMSDRYKPYGNSFAAAAMYFVEVLRSRVLLESIAKDLRGSRGLTGLSSLDRKKLQRIQKRLGEIDYFDKAEAYKKGPQAIKKIEAEEQSLKMRLKDHIRYIREKYPRYAFIYFPKPVTADKIPLRLDEVLIQYANWFDKSYLFVVRKHHPVKVIQIPAATLDLKQRVEDLLSPFRKNSVTGRIQYRDFSAIKAKELFDLLLKPALKILDGDERIIIVPDSVTSVLPFEILVEQQGQTLADTVFVADRRDISYSPSASILALIRSTAHVRPPTSKTLFALGNPIFNKADPRYKSFLLGKQMKKIDNARSEPGQSKPGNLKQYAYTLRSLRRLWKIGKKQTQTPGTAQPGDINLLPLPETESEVRFIANQFQTKPQPPDVLLDINASETRMRETNLKQYRYIHFATHANALQPIYGIREPFLLLGQVENKGRHDGILTISEVMGINLNADMVVLSACSTALGKELTGEGVTNFVYAFQYAGAKSVVVSHWDVASQQTVDFMKTFYSRIAKGDSRKQALSFTRKQIKKQYPNPFFWGSFVLYGESR